MEMKKYKLGEIAKNITDGEHGTVIDDITGTYYLLSNKNIIKYLEVCKDVLKEEVEVVGCESTSDGVYFSDLGIPTIIMNPVGYYPHCPNEYVNKKSLEKLYFIYKKFLEECDFYV